MDTSAQIRIDIRVFKSNQFGVLKTNTLFYRALSLRLNITKGTFNQKSSEIKRVNKFILKRALFNSQVSKVLSNQIY